MKSSDRKKSRVPTTRSADEKAPAESVQSESGVSSPITNDTGTHLGEQQRKGADRRRSRALTIDAYVEGIQAGDRVMLGRAITLIESVHPEHNHLALEVLQRVLPSTGSSIRVGITGIPGVGKSTFIEALGRHVIDRGHSLAVLAIDPSSSISRGSIMGDKTRMTSLSVNPKAFIRPTPSGGSLGGVARKTRETILICEAAGFDVVFVETIGVGQSEVAVHSMVDFFMLLVLAGAGDQLQGIKRGIMEFADAVIINKADGDLLPAAKRARMDYENALHLLRSPASGWTPSVLMCSSLTMDGIAIIWDTILRYKAEMTADGYLERNRRQQMTAWMHETITELLRDRFLTHPAVAHRIKDLEDNVKEGRVPALTAAEELIRNFFDSNTIR